MDGGRSLFLILSQMIDSCERKIMKLHPNYEVNFFQNFNDLANNAAIAFVLLPPAARNSVIEFARVKPSFMTSATSASVNLSVGSTVSVFDDVDVEAPPLDKDPPTKKQKCW